MQKRLDILKKTNCFGERCNMESFLIDMRQIYKIYNAGENEVRALDGVSLQISAGEFVAIVGQSGSGKSTLMNILGCLAGPTSGAYSLSGRDVFHMNDGALSDIRNRQIGFIFQGFNLISSLNAVENVELPLIYRGMDKAERRRMAVEALEQVGLQNRMHHRPAQMSGGQQQRVAIARAIAARPPIIMADEPTGKLDSASGAEVLSAIKALNRAGHTIVLITHDNAIAQSAKRIVRIHDGRIEEDTVLSEAVS